jgi:hypothetical protein
MTYGRSILEDIRLAEEAGMVFPVAEVEVASEDEGGERRAGGAHSHTVPPLPFGLRRWVPFLPLFCPIQWW